jgi:hypothetical protein
MIPVYLSAGFLAGLALVAMTDPAHNLEGLDE